MNDGDALLKACLREPDEDAPRLMYADWLDENAGAAETVRCPRCKGVNTIPVSRRSEEHLYEIMGYTKGPAMPPVALARCPECSGTGTVVRQSSNAARAELIRIQCGRPPCQGDSLWPVEIREAAILATWGGCWRAGSVCGKCEGDGNPNKWDHKPGGSTRMSKVCSDCWGTGDAGGLMRKFAYRGGAEQSLGPPTLVRVRYSRGTKLVEAPTLAECVQECPDCKGEPIGACNFGNGIEYPQCCRCNGDGTVPTDWLLAVVRHHPDVEGVAALDREPFPDHALTLGEKVADTFDWYSRSHGERFEAAVVPAPLFALMKAARPHNTTPIIGDGEALEHPTADAAKLALARAVPAFARGYAAAHPQEEAAA